MTQVKLSTFNNSWYSPGRGLLVRLLWYFTNAIFFINPLNPISELKVILLRLFGAKVGRGVRINPALNIKYPWLLEIGDYTWVGERVWIDNLAPVKISSNCCISQGAMLLTGNHNYKKSSFDLVVKPIVLEDGAWVGAQATICPGVTLGSHSILTVGSIATSNIENYGVYQGNPAVKVRERKISE